MEGKRPLAKRYVFGTGHDGQNCLHWLEDGALLYPVGKTVVLQLPHSSHQRFLEASYSSSAITAIAMSVNRKFVAIAESGAHPQVQIIDTVTRKRRKVLMVSELDSDRYVAVAFSSDGRHLATQGGAPGWNLHYWNWERSQPLGSVSVAHALRSAAPTNADGEEDGRAGAQESSTASPQDRDEILRDDVARNAAARAVTASAKSAVAVTSIGICPADPLLVSVGGSGFLRYYRYTDGLLQPQPNTGVPREQNEVFSAHQWVTAHSVVAATCSGHLYLIQDGRFVCSIDLPPLPLAPLPGAGAPGGVEGLLSPNTTDVITCIAATHRLPQQQPLQRQQQDFRHESGFVVATQNGNVLVFHGDIRSTDRTGDNLPQSDRAEENGAAGAGGAKPREASSYRFVCRVEVPLYEAGEQPWTPPPPSAAAGGGIAEEAGGGDGRERKTDVADGGGTGKGRLGKLFELRHGKAGANTATAGAAKGATSMSLAMAATAPAAAAATGGGGPTAAAAAPDGEALSAEDGAVSAGAPPAPSSLPPSSISATTGTAASAELYTASAKAVNAEAALEAERERRRCRITAIAIDQAEECLAVLTAAGKLYGLDLQQYWPLREELFSSAAKQPTAAGAGSGNGEAPSGITQLAAEMGAEAYTLPPSLLNAMGGQPQPQTSSSSGSNGRNGPPLTLPGASVRASLFSPLFPFTHTGKVTGMSCSVRKPFLITAGADRSVRVWNTQTGQLLMCQFFSAEPGAVAMHPDGLMAVVAFSDKVRVMSVLWNSLRERRTISVRNVTDVQFARGGHLFAVVHNNLVDILDSNTCEQHGQLRGHPQRIKGFQWCATTPYPTDNRAVTCSADGMIMDWSIADLRKQSEHSDKRYQYVAVASDDRSIWAVAAPTSSTAMEVSWKVLLREIDRQSLGTINSTNLGGGGGGAGAAAGGGGGAMAGGAQSTSVGDFEFTESALTTLMVAPHQRVLVAGGDDGSVKPIAFPLQSGIQEPPLAAHAHPVTAMALTFDETTLFTAAEDGSIMMWTINPEKEATGPASAANTTAAAQHLDPTAREAQSSSEEVLVTRQEVEEHGIEIDALRQLLEKLKTDMESEEKRRVHEEGTRTRERAEELQHIAVTLAAEYDALCKAKEDQEKTFLDVKTEKDREAAARRVELETQRQAEVDAQEEACTALQHTLKTAAAHHAEDLRGLRQRLETARVEDEAHYQDVLAQRAENMQKLRRQLEQSQETNRVTLHQLELDTDAEVQALQHKQVEALHAVRERYLHLKGEGAVMRKNASKLEREIEVRTSELQLLDGAKVALQSQLTTLTHQVAQLHQDIDERDSVTEKKEKVIYSLKKQNQELEKHKYVLDHQIRDLKGQIEPKHREIAELNMEIKRQNTNLEEQHGNNMTLRANTDELKKDIAEQQDGLQARLRELKRLEAYRARATKDFGELGHILQDPVALAVAINHLYKTHVTVRDLEAVAPANPQVDRELASQLEYLSSSLVALQRKLKADQRRHKQEVSTMMAENLARIREIHSLREEMVRLRVRIAAEAAAKQKHAQQRRSTAASRHGNNTSSAAAAAAGEASIMTVDAAAAAPRRSVDYAQSDAGGSVATGAASHYRRQQQRRAGTSRQRPPTPPVEIAENVEALRQVRTYVAALERVTGGEEGVGASSGGIRLPPMDPEESTPFQ